MDEANETIIEGQQALYRAPENFCRAIFLQIAARTSRARAGRPGREVAKFFSSQAERALGSESGFGLWDCLPEGPEFGDASKRGLLLAAAREIVASLKVAHESPENWNACPRWGEWGVVKASELLEFLEREAGHSNGDHPEP